MLVKRNESYNLRDDYLVLETSGDLDVKVEVKREEDFNIKGFTIINDFNWFEAEKRLQELLKRKRERVFFISFIYKVRDDLDLNYVNEFDVDEFVSEYVDNNLLDKIECMTLEEIIDKYWEHLYYRPFIKSIDNSYIVLASDDWDNDLVLYIDAIMGYTDLETQYYLVHEDN